MPFPNAPGSPSMPPKPPAMPGDGSSTGGGGDLQTELMQRLRALSPQDRQALITGVSPQARAVIAKVLPEIAPIIMGAGGAASTGAPPPNGMAPAEPPMSAGPPRPKTALGRI